MSQEVGCSLKVIRSPLIVVDFSLLAREKTKAHPGIDRQWYGG